MLYRLCLPLSVRRLRWPKPDRGRSSQGTDKSRNDFLSPSTMLEGASTKFFPWSRLFSDWPKLGLMSSLFPTIHSRFWLDWGNYRFWESGHEIRLVIVSFVQFIRGFALLILLEVEDLHFDLVLCGCLQERRIKLNQVEISHGARG